MSIKTIIEGPRGCGYRKKGGLYFISDGAAGVCGALPLELSVCRCCGAGVKFTRGFTWINSDLFTQTCTPETVNCITCPVNQTNLKMGLLWVGESFYKTPGAFEKESARQGISRRIGAVPRGFEVGRTWVALAHIKAYCRNNPETQITEHVPGVFSFFRPTRIEYVVTGSETPEELQALEDRGLTLVNVVRDIEIQQTLNL